MVKLAQASYDENGGIYYGEAGNQNGRELNFSNWYANGWLTCIRFKDAKKAKICGDTAIDAVNNANIGYDQIQRNTLLTQAKKVNFDLTKIKTKCETDCSALAGVCMIAAGAPESKMYRNGNLCYTGNIAQWAKDTGLVSVFTSSQYCGTSANLRHGDILVSGGHAVIVVDGTKKSGTSSTSSTKKTVAEIKYRASTDSKGKTWLSEITGNTTNAGTKGQPIRWLAMKFPGWYQVKTEKNGWLPKVTKYDIKDLDKGCAGDGSPIVAVRCYYETQDPGATGWKQIEYQVRTVGGGWLPKMKDLKSTGGDSDDFAGNGARIDGIKARVINS